MGLSCAIHIPKELRSFSSHKNKDVVFQFGSQYTPSCKIGKHSLKNQLMLANSACNLSFCLAWLGLSWAIFLYLTQSSLDMCQVLQYIYCYKVLQVYRLSCQLASRNGQGNLVWFILMRFCDFYQATFMILPRCLIYSYIFCDSKILPQ